MTQLINGIEDLGLDKQDTLDQVLVKLRDKLNLSINNIVYSFEEYILINSLELAQNLFNVAPYGRYEDLIEETDKIVEFLKSECGKVESWQLKSIEQEQETIRLDFMSKAVDEADALRGIVFIDYFGNIIHSLCVSDV